MLECCGQVRSLPEPATGNDWKLLYAKSGIPFITDSVDKKWCMTIFQETSTADVVKKRTAASELDISKISGGSEKPAGQERSQTIAPSMPGLSASDSALPTCLRRPRPRRASHSVGGRACNAPLPTRPWTRLRRPRKNAPPKRASKNMPVGAPATRLQKRACGRACHAPPKTRLLTRLQRASKNAPVDAPAMYRATPLVRLLAGRRAWIAACARLLHGRAPEHTPSPPLLYACPVLRPVLARVRPSRLCGGCASHAPADAPETATVVAPWRRAWSAWQRRLMMRRL